MIGTLLILSRASTNSVLNMEGGGVSASGYKYSNINNRLINNIIMFIIILELSKATNANAPRIGY